MKKLIRILTVVLAASSMVVLIAGRSIVRAQSADDLTSVPQATSSPVNLLGSWTGTNDTCSGCTFDLDVLKQKGKTIHGIFDLETDGETPGGKMNGKVVGNAITMTLHATMGTNHPCTAKATATLSGPNTMDGAFTVVHNRHCDGAGTFTITR